MKLKVVVVDLELTRRQKRIGAGGLVVAIALVTGAAFAEVPKVFVAGETLKAADLNENFARADERISALEAIPTYLVSTSDEAQTGEFGTDFVYDSMEVTLQPGTWLVEANATLSTTLSSDQVQLGLWNQTAVADIPSSRGPVSQSDALNGGTSCGAQSCIGAPGSASAVITVAAPTVIRAKAFRNGASTLTMGPWISGIVLSPVNRISALRLR